MKKKFYFNMGSREISQVPNGNNDSFVIFATDEEVRQLRQRLEDMNAADQDAFYQVHYTLKPYVDKQNDAYDSGIMDAFQMIYDLGDNETKYHIENMGILNNPE